jgi:mono/diheme cytochrome c family protein
MRRLALLLAALALVVGAVACGGGEDEGATPETVEGTLPTETGGAGGATEGDAEAGKAIFAAQGCGGCHVFAAAGSSGTIGPNLDDSTADFQAAVTQIENGGDGMPAFGDKLSDEEIANVAAFVTEERAG